MLVWMRGNRVQIANNVRGAAWRMGIRYVGSFYWVNDLNPGRREYYYIRVRP